MANLTDARLIRVRRSNPCPICNKPSWCSVAEDESIAICMRIADGAFKETRNGGYLHRLVEARNYQPLTVHSISNQSVIAPIECRHALYTDFLVRLGLSKSHRENLQMRGLSHDAISRNRYASLPQSFSDLLKLSNALSDGHELAGVPGFYLNCAKRWQLVPAYSGLVIPVRDVLGRIQGCQIRRNSGTPRYIWLSSNEKAAGTSSGAPVHFARPWQVASAGQAIITEGALKADVISDRLDCCVVAVAGVSSFQADFGEWLRLQLPDLRSVLIAFDADWRQKREVAGALSRLIETLRLSRLSHSVLNWQGAKGLDDLLSLSRKEVA